MKDAQRDADDTSPIGMAAMTTSIPALLSATTSSAAQVLTNSALFYSIVAFIEGVPQHVLQFKETEVPRHHRKVRGGYFMLMSMPSLALWEVAILCSNSRVLEALAALSVTQRYSNCLRVQLDPMLGFAVANVSDVSFIDWLFRHICSTGAQRTISESNFEALALRSRRDTDEHIVAIAQWVHDRLIYSFPQSMMDAAAAAGNLALVCFLHEHSANGCTRKAQSDAMANGHVDVLRFLHEHRSEGCDPNAVNKAAMRGLVDCIVFAHTHNFEGFSVATMSIAVKAGHLEVVEFLHKYRTEGCTLEAFVEADMNDHDDVVEFLCRNRPIANISEGIRFAIGYGRGKLAARLAQQRLPWTSSVSTSMRFAYPHEQH